MIPAWLLRFWQPILALVALGVIFGAVKYYGHQRYEAGRESVIEEYAIEARIQKARFDLQVAADAARLKAAEEAHAKELEALRAARAQPVPRVVCRKADPKPVPADPGVHEDHASRAGPLQERAPESAQPFDPTEALEAIATEADELLASCRRLHQEVHGIPSG